MSGHKLIIKQQRSFLWNFTLIVVALSVLGLSFYAGRFLAVSHEQQLLDKVSWLEQKLDEYQKAYQKAQPDICRSDVPLQINFSWLFAVSAKTIV